jgi:putative membrane protein
VNFLLRLLVNAAALYVATRIVDGVHFEGDWLTLFTVALIFGVVNAVIKPVTKFFTFPLIILSFGLFLLVINGLMLILTSRISGWFDLGFSVQNFRAAFWGGLVISIVNALGGIAIGDEKRRRASPGS